MTNAATPALSVIVTLVDGGDALLRCLDALAAQRDAPAMEVIIPYDDAAPDIRACIERHPNFTFLAMGKVVDAAPRNEFEKHDLYDRRRTAGLHAAKAPLIAMIEDRGAPRPDWARAMADLHTCYTDAAIGGAVEHDGEGVTRWAIFFVDFSRYQAPFASLHPEYVTDTNICYKREALMAVEPLWREKYQESAVNWALRDKGYSLRLDPAPVTAQLRNPPGLAALASERFNWGRVYGEQRARAAPLSRKLTWMAMTPLLPVVLYARHLRNQVRIGRHVGAYVAATPLIVFLLAFWALGELRGYLDAKA
ncbi:MAG: hypothetical protein GC189_04115 [Alphaproteobacteria bacterium]|nr:hypothetical protein [Alphaproteobacteria bacterium]